MRHIISCLTLTFILLGQAFGQQFKGMDFNDEATMEVARKTGLTRSLMQVPSEASIKAFAPFPKNQGAFGTCTAWASSYCAHTIVKAINTGMTNREEITRIAYSPAFLFRMLKPDDQSCNGGSVLVYALELMKTKGALPYTAVPMACIPSITEAQLQQAAQEKIADYVRLFDVTADANQKIHSIKKSISERKPVVFGMKTPNSFDHAKEVWVPTEEPSSVKTGHAMCVVGYDDKKYGGSFEIQNSWGVQWGNQGYIWIKYEDLARYTDYAFELVELPIAKPNQVDLSGEIQLLMADQSSVPLNLLESTRGLKVTSANQTSPLTYYQTKKPFYAGDRFRIHILNNQPAFVYAFSADDSQIISKLFPHSDNISPALTDSKNEVIIPDEQHYIEFDEVAGKEELCILYCKSPLDFNQFLADLKKQQGSFSEKIYQTLKNKLVDPKHIDFSKEKVAFQSKSQGKDIVSLIIKMDHK